MSAEWWQSYSAGDGAFDAVGDLVRAVLEVDVEALFSDVDLAVGEPSMEVEIVDAQDCLGEGMPSHALGLISPVTDRIVESVLESRLVGGETASKSR